MLSHRFYYALKPFVPWRLRMALRQLTARRKLRRCAAVWPIDPSTNHPPAGWTGWPEGRKFAFVLTHDVEGPEGLARVRELAELEMSLGFRSSFNFIPEGPYAVPPELRAWLTQNGFEVGVHDLHHDGKLFASHRGFIAKAKRINHYLREWNASGYRSGFMLRNLDWLHELAICYDSSTFDTDPFEPQSDGAGTIFPYWIPAPNAPGAKSEALSAKSSRSDPELVERAPPSPLPPALSEVERASLSRSQPVERPPLSRSDPELVERAPPQRGGGYVELPYTLPQDSTLFFVLQEKTPDIWLRKLDWIATHGGMALINVHPDYVRFVGGKAVSRSYSVEHYRRFLEHVRSVYAGRYWPALPREVAAHVVAMPVRPVRRRPKRICMITHSFYEVDNRVTRYAESLAARGDQVDVLALRRGPELAAEETIEGVRVFRLQDRFGKTEKSLWSYLWPSLRFLIVTSWWVCRRQARDRYDLLHVHNIPDFLVFAAWYPKLTGARVILDIHDIVPEFFGSKFGQERKGAMTLLLWMERWSARMADHIIISNHLWLELYAARTRASERCSVFINNVNARVFQPRLRTRHDDRLIVLFPGGLQWHQGLDIALRAFVRVVQELPHAEFHIYGDGNMKPVLLRLTTELGLDGKVRFFDPVRITEIAQVMADADLGVVPKRADSFGNEAYSTKIMEFMSVGVPVVVSRTKIDEYYFNDSVVKFFDSGSAEALATAMLEVLRDPAQREQLRRNASAYAQEHSWDSRQADYLRLVDSL